MSEVSGTGAAAGGIAARPLGRPVAAERTAKQAPSRQAARPSDRVELSDRARYLAKLNEVPPVRQGLVDQVRAQIEEGTYDTPERLGAAVDGVVDDLDLMS